MRYIDASTIVASASIAACVPPVIKNCGLIGSSELGTLARKVRPAKSTFCCRYDEAGCIA